MCNEILELSLEDKLYRTKYEPDSDHPHIQVDNEICQNCDSKTCVQVCPAGVYKRDPNDEKRVTVSHDNCLECGTCTKACQENAIDWQYPDGGMGVKYRFG